MASPTPHALTSASSTEESCGEEARRGEEGGGKEKEELIGKILELQNTLHDLTQRVNSVKEENTKLKSENEASVMVAGVQDTLLTPIFLSIQVLNQYIENLMATSGTFKASDGKK